MGGTGLQGECWSPMMMFVPGGRVGVDWMNMSSSSKVKAVLTDSHFLIPLIVFCVGLGLLIVLH